MDIFNDIEFNVIDPFKTTRTNSIKENNYFETICERTGYNSITNFWSEFTQADQVNKAAIQATYDNFNETFKDNVKYFTELVMVLNWKCWYYYETGQQEYNQLYEDLYYEAYDYGLDHFKGDDLTYFWRTLD